jgi:hypothetical protein
LEIAAIKVPYQVFDFLRDGIRYNLNHHIELKHRPSDDYSNLIEDTIRFIEAHDKFTHTDQIRALFEQAKILPSE